MFSSSSHTQGALPAASRKAFDLLQGVALRDRLDLAHEGVVWVTWQAVRVRLSALWTHHPLGNGRTLDRSPACVCNERRVALDPLSLPLWFGLLFVVEVGCSFTLAYWLSFLSLFLLYLWYEFASDFWFLFLF